jgi:hypothetical protein
LPSVLHEWDVDEAVEPPEDFIEVRHDRLEQDASLDPAYPHPITGQAECRR